ncbi:MAG: hypothetical protein ABIP89_10420 [Polyangiaceae bacterium]
MTTEEEAPSADLIFETLWGRVMEAWDDDKTHGALLDYAIRAQLLADAAGRYRAMQDDPERGVVAKKKLDGIVLAATQMMLAMKTPAPTKTPVAITLSAAAVCAISVAWAAYAILRR